MAGEASGAGGPKPPLAVVGAKQLAAPEDARGAASQRVQTTVVEGSPYEPGNRIKGSGTDDYYLKHVQPTLAQSCATCHSCNSSPCQHKVTSFEGVERGASPLNVLNSDFFSASSGLTRMKDAKSVEEWRAKGFYSVIEGGKRSTMYKLLAHGKEHNRPGFDLQNAKALYDNGVGDLRFEALDTPEKVKERLSKPGTGMPFGSLGPTDDQYRTLMKWLEDGALGPTAEAQKALRAPRDPAMVARWETFFNQSTPKAKLTMRYLFEHLAFSRLHFDESEAGKGDLFELVRSRTPPGQPIDEIVTETDNGDPQGAFFYRLKKHTEVITAKDHTVFHLTSKEKARWEELFLNSEWQPPAKLPGYDSENPFEAFDAIPAKARAQFMLENSHRLIQAMVQADACTGSPATFAIRDRFSAVFLKPESDPTVVDPKLGQGSYWHIDPSASILTSGFREDSFATAFQASLAKLRPNGLSVDDLWDGGKTDKNAWITILRHGTNASAHQGPVGQLPETMWVVDYGNFERLFYDLVVNHRPWGTLHKKLSTWTTMSHIRQHGEDLFLMLLPEKHRDKVRQAAVLGQASPAEASMDGKGYPTGFENVDDQRPMEDVVSRIRKYLGPAIAGSTTLDPDPMAPADTEPPAHIKDKDSLERALRTLTVTRGKAATALPENTWLSVREGDQVYDYSLVRNRIYDTNATVLDAADVDAHHLPQLDSISVARGHVGAYPSLFLQMNLDEVPELIQAGRNGPEALMAVRLKYGVKRNEARFPQVVDEEIQKAFRERPLDSGILDLRDYVWDSAAKTDGAKTDKK